MGRLDSGSLRAWDAVAQSNWAMTRLQIKEQDQVGIKKTGKE